MSSNPWDRGTRESNKNTNKNSIEHERLIPMSITCLLHIFESVTASQFESSNHSSTQCLGISTRLASPRHMKLLIISIDRDMGMFSAAIPGKHIVGGQVGEQDGGFSVPGSRDIGRVQAIFALVQENKSGSSGGNQAGNWFGFP